MSKKENRKTRNIVMFVAVLVILVVAYAIYVNVINVPKYPSVYIPKPYEGNASARVIVTEYSDFECPACGMAETIVRTLRSEYRDRIAFRYVHFPLTNIHPDAFKAAEASECANDQGKFWEYHDKLYENQRGLGTGLYYSIAKSLDLNFSQFKQCFDTDATKDVVMRDLRESLGKNLRGTPSFFVNDIPVENFAYENLKKIIDEELKK
jgi:protein-disulfide isomerase